jgi:hypothetical protein
MEKVSTYICVTYHRASKLRLLPSTPTKITIHKNRCFNKAPKSQHGFERFDGITVKRLLVANFVLAS